MQKICVIGLGYVGLPLAVEFGKKFNVIGFDINKGRVDSLKNAVDSTNECSKEEILSAKSLSFTSKENDISGFDVYIVTVPTPIDESNHPDLSYLKEASQIVGRNISRNKICIFESTVYPGTTEEICIPIIENISGLSLNVDFFCGYSPERINPGDKENTITKIKKIVSGSDQKTLDDVDNLYSEIIEAGTYRASSIKVAEAAKVIENSQRDLNIAFVNELSIIFNLMNIDTDEVLDAASSKWNFLRYNPGLVGGHCIGVDPYYLTYKSEQLGYSPEVILSGRRVNENMSKFAAREIIKMIISEGLDVNQAKVGVLGITFKENCPDTRNSKVYDLINELSSWGVETLVSDCWADEDLVKKESGISLIKIDEMTELDSIIIVVGHNEYRHLALEKIKKMCKKNQKPILGDLKSLYSLDDALGLGFKVFRL